MSPDSGDINVSSNYSKAPRNELASLAIKTRERMVQISRARKRVCCVYVCKGTRTVVKLALDNVDPGSHDQADMNCVECDIHLSRSAQIRSDRRDLRNSTMFWTYKPAELSQTIESLPMYERTNFVG